jgi:non-reducing end alpha-L-arabinofuranosidase
VEANVGARPFGQWLQPDEEGRAIILGTGGDMSIKGAGTFYEGAMTASYPTDATENAVQANILVAGYK